ncbi:MAG: acyl-CoA desaturase [Cyanobacteria bacterium RYN_339]|nr:acyl-CoA desaturase [Cyanobacteria bacterium RYN_339]
MDDLTPPMDREAFRRMVYTGQLMKVSGVLAALALVATRHVSWLDLALCSALSVFTMLGVTAGMHRLYAHRSYQAHPWLAAVLAAAGTMSGQGSVLIWAAVHRKHHAHGDQAQDPHSPEHGGVWHAHTGWILKFYPEDLARYVPDLLADPVLRWQHRHMGLLLWAGLLFPALVGGIYGGWWGALTGYVWGGWARMFLVEQSACLVNSAGHVWGSRPFDTRDRSTNLGLFALLSLGDGWHNNHHAFPGSARHGLTWFQLDPTWWVIRACQALRLVKDVNVPDPSVVARRLL